MVKGHYHESEMMGEAGFTKLTRAFLTSGGASLIRVSLMMTEAHAWLQRTPKDGVAMPRSS